MTKKIITAKKVLIKQGTTQKGKPWKRTTILSTDGLYYSTFETTSIIDAIIEGTEVNLEFKEGVKGNDITKIISILQRMGTPNANSPNTQSTGSGEPQGAIMDIIVPIDINLRVRARLITAKIMVDETFETEPLDYSLYAPLVAECMHQLFSEEMAIRIQRNKEKNIRNFKTG
jgi:hypothetical protein